MAQYNDGLRTQASLGTEFRRLYNESSNIDRITLAEVIKVNYRYNTVDVKITIDNTVISNSGADEGRFSAKLPVEFGGRTLDGKPYGQINPIDVGSLVLLGFLDGKKTKPIVLSVYGKADVTKELSRAPFSGVDPKDESLKGLANQKFTVYPSLTYENIDGVGNRTVSFTGKSFMVMDADTNPEMSAITDDGDGHRYEDLKTSYYYSGELIEPKDGKAPTILFKHQGDKYGTDEVEEDSHSFMFFLGQDGTYRTSILREDEDWRSYFEMTPDGTVKIRRQNDTKAIGQGNAYHELSVGKDGIGMRSGDKFLLFNEKGIDSNTGFGGGGGGTGELPDLSDIYDRLGTIDGNILSMGTRFERTDELILMSANKVVELEGKVTDYDAQLVIMANVIATKVTESTVTGMINDSLTGLTEDLTDLAEKSKESMEALRELAEDGMLTAVEKKIVLREWDMIRAEYPGYKSQVEEAELDSTEYTTRYEALKTYVTPILANMESTTAVDRVIFNNMFSNYYTARGNALYAVFDKLRKDINQAAQVAIDAALDANEAIADAAKATVDAIKANKLLEDIAADNKVTPSEKQQLIREYNEVLSEWENIVSQGVPYSIDTSVFEQAKDSILNYVSSVRLFNDMQATTEVDGEQLRKVFKDYYKERSAILVAVSKATKGLLDEFRGELEYYNTEIIQTSREIALIAESVKIIGEEIEVAKATLTVQSERIEARVTKSEFYRQVNATLDDLNNSGRNQYIQENSAEGTLNENTGEVMNPTDGDRVSAYIPVVADTGYTATLFSNKGLNKIVVTWYDANKVYISSHAVSGSEEKLTLTKISPVGSAYARVTAKRASSVDIQFEKGTIATNYKVSPEDMAVNITLATREQKSRQETAEASAITLQEYKANAVEYLAKVEGFVSNYSISPQEKLELKKELDKIELEYPNVIAEAQINSINSGAYTGHYSALKTYLMDFFEKMDEATAVVPTTMMGVFKPYYDERTRIYTTISKNANDALRASNELLEKATQGAVEAERIARELASNAEAAARSVSASRANINDAVLYESKTMGVINRVSEDAKLVPTEKIEVDGIMSAIGSMQNALTASANVYSLSTADLDNSYNQLVTYFSPMVTVEKIREITPISTQTFRTYFEDYFNAKSVLLENILRGAQGVYEISQEQADTARQEALRKEAQMQVYQNAVIDAEAAIKRLDESIDILKNNVAYKIELMSSNGLIFKNSVIDTTLTARLYKGDQDITNAVPVEGFVWKKTKADGTPDDIWNRTHEEVGNKLHITHNDVSEKATFEVEIFTEEGGEA